MNSDKRGSKKLKLSRSMLLACSAALGVIIVGCTVGPDYKKPATTMPGDWEGTTQTPATTQASNATTQPLEIVTWWASFKDPTLDSLIERAMLSNLDLRAAEARILQARAARGVSESALWPTVDANASYTRRHVSGSGAGGGGSTSGSRRDLYTAGVDASWELDLWGRVRRDIEAADADIQATVDDRRDVLISIASEVALSYVNLRGLQRQLTISRQNLEAQRSSEELTRRRFAGGLVSGLDVANAQAQVATTLSQIPLVEQAAQQQIYNIALLLALEPQELNRELSGQTAPIPTTPPMIPVGLPSELLRRRPDVRRAEAQLHSATARIGVATADLFPRFALTGSIGVAGNKPKDLGNWDNRFWAFGPGVSWNIFDAGRIRSNINIQKAVRQEFLAAYQKAVLTALRDVESALIAYAKEQMRREALAQAVAADTRAVDLSTQLYTQGQTDFLNVLSAQRSLYASQSALVISESNVATNLVSLYKALGGGWELDMPADDHPTTAPTSTADAH